MAGAEAVYFGADQPRITAELLIPWSALGIGPPRPGMSLRAEVTVTSWDRERSMSLSGHAPATTMKNPGGWVPMRLGNGAQMIQSSPLPALPAPG